MKRIVISVFSLAAVLLLTLSPALALATATAATNNHAAARHAATTITSKADVTEGGPWHGPRFSVIIHLGPK